MSMRAIELMEFTQRAAVYLSDSVFDSLSFPVRKRVPQNPFFSMEKAGF
jgi:hypothetical protein